MLSRVTVNIIRRSVCSNARTLCHTPRCLLQSELSLCNDGARSHSVQNHYDLYIAKRFKSSKKKIANIRKDKDEDSDEEKEKDDEVEIPMGSKVIKKKVLSLRLDAISKIGFGISRNKIEEIFYDSRLRVNGKKVLKKSKEVQVEDEIDMILHQSVDNPGFLVVNRIVILSIYPTHDGIQIKLSVDRNLLIEDYQDSYL